MAEQILDAGSDYLLQVKNKQPCLLQELKDSFPKLCKGYTRHKEEDLGHGRIETRQMKSPLCLRLSCWRTPMPPRTGRVSRASIGKTRKRCDKRTGK